MIILRSFLIIFLSILLMVLPLSNFAYGQQSKDQLPGESTTDPVDELVDRIKAIIDRILERIREACDEQESDSRLLQEVCIRVERLERA